MYLILFKRNNNRGVFWVLRYICDGPFFEQTATD